MAQVIFQSISHQSYDRLTQVSFIFSSPIGVWKYMKMPQIQRFIIIFLTQIATKGVTAYHYRPILENIATISPLPSAAITPSNITCWIFHQNQNDILPLFLGLAVIIFIYIIYIYIFIYLSLKNHLLRIPIFPGWSPVFWFFSIREIWSTIIHVFFKPPFIY